MTSAKSAETLYALYENCDPDLLKRTRENAGVDEGVLARKACLSVAQVRQLEAGGNGLFYSITIKRQAYKRLMMVLGAEPPTHVPVAQAIDSMHEALPDVSSKETIDSIVALSSKSDYLDKRPVADFVIDLRYRIMAHRQVLGALVLLIGALVLFVFHWPEITQDEPSKAVVPVKAQAPDASASKDVKPSTVQAPATSSSATAVAPLPVPETKPEVKPEPVVNVPAVVAASAPVVAANTKACVFVDDRLPEVMPSSANKPAGFVYVLSPIDTEVCVIDASKKATVLQLRAGEGRSVYGSAPWQLSGAALKDAQIYFQGVRVRAPEGAGARFNLIERASTP